MTPQLEFSVRLDALFQALCTVTSATDKVKLLKEGISVLVRLPISTNSRLLACPIDARRCHLIISNLFVILVAYSGLAPISPPNSRSLIAEHLREIEQVIVFDKLACQHLDEYGQICEIVDANIASATAILTTDASEPFKPRFIKLVV